MMDRTVHGTMGMMHGAVMMTYGTTVVYGVVDLGH